MKKLKLIAVFLLLAAYCAPACLAVPTYSGSLTSADGGINGNNGWTTDENHHVTFDWSVTFMGSYWHYEYTFNIDENLQGALSHLIIEVSGDLEYGDIENPSPLIESDNPKWYYGGPQSNSNTNPDMPNNVFGIKFGITDGEGSTTVSFNLKRDPVWGDFYAKDGVPGGAAWNAGFTNLDADPTAHWSTDPTDPSVWGHILVPDTTFIPAPGAILLGSIGVGLVGWLKRRRTI